jgi:hypothetical protein
MAKTLKTPLIQSIWTPTNTSINTPNWTLGRSAMVGGPMRDWMHMQDTSCWLLKGESANCKALEKKALKYIHNLYEITSTTWEDYLKLQKKKRPKVVPAEHQTTINPTADLPTFSNKEAGADANAGGISAPPPPTYHTNHHRPSVRFNFLEIAAKQRAGTATAQEEAQLWAALDAQAAAKLWQVAQAMNQTPCSSQNWCPLSLHLLYLWPIFCVFQPYFVHLYSIISGYCPMVLP